MVDRVIHQGTTRLIITHAVSVTLDEHVGIRLFIVEAIDIRVRLEARTPCVTVVHQSCKHDEDIPL